MNLNKKVIIGALGATAIGAGLGGKKGLETGLGLGLKTGFAVGMTSGIVGFTVCLLAKNKIKNRCILNEEE